VAAVGYVDNQIEVLPVSRLDDIIRRRLIRAIYGDSILKRYGAEANLSIWLIVRQGNVTPEGYVDRETDLNIAFIRANGVKGVHDHEPSQGEAHLTPLLVQSRVRGPVHSRSGPA
jgi:hypothetical protein